MANMNAQIGEQCSNTPFLETFSCPNCYHDHPGGRGPSGLHGKTFRCGCGALIHCEIERQPVYICTIVEPEPDVEAVDCKVCGLALGDCECPEEDD